jgi:hypothetical protein
MNDRVKVKLSLCFNWAPRHEGVLGEWRYSSTHSLNSALDGGERSASRPDRFTPRERAPGTHWIGGWVGSRAILDAVVKRKIPSPRRESSPRTPIVQPVGRQGGEANCADRRIWAGDDLLYVTERIPVSGQRYGLSEIKLSCSLALTIDVRLEVSLLFPFITIIWFRLSSYSPK